MEVLAQKKRELIIAARWWLEVYGPARCQLRNFKVGLERFPEIQTPQNMNFHGPDTINIDHQWG